MLTIIFHTFFILVLPKKRIYVLNLKTLGTKSGSLEEVLLNNEKTQQRLFFSLKRKWRKWWLKDERKWKKTTLPSEILKVQFSSVNCLTVRFGFRKVKCKIEVKWLSSIYIKKNLPGLYGTRQFLRTLFHWSPYLNHISAYKLTRFPQFW
jgi:hypothetical protein